MTARSKKLFAVLDSDGTTVKTFLGEKDARLYFQDSPHELLVRTATPQVPGSRCWQWEQEIDHRSGGTEQIQKLKTALREILGFATRNRARAEKAVEAAKKQHALQLKMGGPVGRADGESLEGAEARLHEAVRVHQVIDLRVKEALRE